MMFWQHLYNIKACGILRISISFFLWWLNQFHSHWLWFPISTVKNDITLQQVTLRYVNFCYISGKKKKKTASFSARPPDVELSRMGINFLGKKRKNKHNKEQYLWDKVRLPCSDGRVSVLPDALVILRGSLAVQNVNTISTVQDPHHSLEKQTIKTFSNDTTNDTITGPHEGHLSFFEQSFGMFLINKK